MVLPSFLVRRLVGVQARPKKHAQHAVIAHRLCHLLQLACMQAANSLTGIKHVYTTLTTLWKYFHYSPNRAESLKEIHHVLNLPEMKVIKPSGTRCLHEWCVKAVKVSYTALVITFDSSYQNFHAPEASELYKALSKFTTIAAIYLLDDTLLLVAKLSNSLQTKQLDLSMISSLVNAVLHALDDAITLAAYWVLELLDSMDDPQQATGEIVSIGKTHTFQEMVGTPFVALLKENILIWFVTHDVSALAIFGLRNVPSTNSSYFPTCGKKLTEVFLNHYGKGKLALTGNDVETLKTAVISPEMHTEWITFRTSLAKKPETALHCNLKLNTNEVLVTMFPNLQKIASIGLTLPVSTAYVERSFSQMKLIKTFLQNSYH